MLYNVILQQSGKWRDLPQTSSKYTRVAFYWLEDDKLVSVNNFARLTKREYANATGYDQSISLSLLHATHTGTVFE